MARKRRGPTLGSIIHRDSSGRKVGYSEPNILGGYVDYDRHGRIIGQSKSDGSGGYDHFDGWGNPAGHSDSGEYVHNPHDAFFKTGSYDYKEKRNKASSTSSSPSYLSDSKSKEAAVGKMPQQSSCPSQITHWNDDIEIGDYRKRYIKAVKDFLSVTVLSCAIIYVVGFSTYVFSDKDVAIVRTIIFTLITAVFFGGVIWASSDELKHARLVWLQEKKQAQKEKAVQENTEKVNTQKEKTATSKDSKPITKQEIPPAVSSRPIKSSKKKKEDKSHNKLQKKEKSFLWHSITKSRENRILLLTTGLAGSQFHIKSEAERAALHNLQTGTELILRREPDNKYDQWAIAVYLTEDDKIGFISRFKNETVARLMDAGKKCIAIIEDSTEQAENAAHHSKPAPTENMQIPFSVYLVETK